MIVEDGAFIGSRCIVTEGVVIGERRRARPERVLSGVDADHRRHRPRAGRAPRLRAAASVVVPGTRPKEFPAGTYQLGCALIIGQRSASTDLKTSLNDALREYGIGA